MNKAIEEALVRLQEASGPSRELDEAIMAIRYRRERRCIGAQEQQDDGSWKDHVDLVWVDPSTDKWVSTGAHEFTRSIDAALTLVPECCDVRKFTDDPSGTGWTLSEFGNGTIIHRGIGVTAGLPAIALCIAALKARNA